jgi:hypothetical protein
MLPASCVATPSAALFAALGLVSALAGLHTLFVNSHVDALGSYRKLGWKFVEWDGNLNSPSLRVAEGK